MGWQKYQRKKKELKKEKRELKALDKEKLKRGAKITDEDLEKEERYKAELSLLVDDEEKGAKGDFKADTNDPRFSAIYKDPKFYIDPTSKNFKSSNNFFGEQVKRRPRGK
eukprot:TRINITY_DN12253_c0_g1_i1.p1 TRINITY_DN12253_c0_g1~~TRINITY_DN12253_c0_g1_i1.p1  ORF type:complete len:110 (-),score=47.64 TRINITY_DN12253_c0_g1_i1:121-450(-)